MAAKASYVSLALLLLVGTQLAMGKSVDENFKDDRYNVRALNKRASANEKSKDTAADATTESPEEEVTPIWLITTSKPPKARRQTAKAAATMQAITTPADDDESTTMASLELQEELEEKEDIAPVRPLNNDKQEKPKKKPKQPPTLLDRIKPDDEPTTAAPAPGNPMPPATNLLPPMPYYPQSYGSFPNPAFAPWGFGPAPGPYDYPHPSGPAFSDSKVGGTGSNSGAFAGGFASASASAGGSGTTITTSNTSPDGTSAHQSSHSFSSSGPGPVGIGIRGSFGGGDDDSVAIEVNGPVPSGVPTYSSQQPGYAVSGPGYSASASFSPSPFMNTIPNYGYSGPNDFQNFFQQYFATLQAQQQAFQQQLQAQIQAQQQAIWDQSNRLDSNMGSPGGSYSSPNGPASAYSSINLGPQGGYQTAQINPAAPGIFSRFGESVPAPSGGQYGVFSSSSSSSSTGPDGKTLSRKTATVGVNDNGKVSYKTVRDP